MLKRLKIKNFRAHRKLDIRFSKGVNSIIGKNAAGKSTILRAIKYVAQNKPSGDSVINWDSKKTTVKLFTGNNKVTRIRSKAINLYKLNDKEFKAFGNNVPPEIQKALGLSDINFQGQHDPPFWFCETAGEVSRQLNQIVNLKVIDTTLANIVSVINKTKIIIEVTKEKIKEAKIQKQGLAYIKEVDTDLIYIEQLKIQKDKKVVGGSLLLEIIGLGEIYEKAYKNGLDQATQGNKTILIGSRCREITDNIENLSKCLKSTRILRKAVKNRPPSFKPLQTLNDQLGKILTKTAILETLIKRIEEREIELCQLQKNLKENQRKLNQLTKGKCPLCGVVKKK